MAVVMVVYNICMCGRYGFIPGEKFYDRFEVSNRLENLEARYNVAPGERMPVVTRNSPNKAEIMKWGLVPFWAKDPRIGYKMINARAEDIVHKPAFRKPIRSQRCLIPASGFYEWKHLDKEKIPYYIRLKNRELFAFAGLYDVWKDAEGKEIASYTVITTTPNTVMEPIHNRMPVILHQKDEDAWLDKETPLEKVLLLLRPYEGDMEAYTVSKAVNKADIDTPELIKPAEPPEEQQKLV